jgi:hypothetical protein
MFGGIIGFYLQHEMIEDLQAKRKIASRRLEEMGSQPPPKEGA